MSEFEVVIEGQEIHVSIETPEIQVVSIGESGPIGPVGPGSTWGGIVGALADQTDLQSALDAKANGTGTTSGTNTGDQTITLTGAVTGSGQGSFAASLGSFTVAQLNTAISDADVATASALSALTLDQLADVTAPTPAVGNQLLWDGTAWIASAPVVAGGGASKAFFLTADASLADNYTLATYPSGTAEVTRSAVCDADIDGGVTFIERYVSAPLGGTSIEGGQWTFNTYASVSNDNGVSTIVVRINKRVEQSGITVTFTGSGATRTLTATGGAPFLPGHANADVLLAALIETPTQTAWINGYTSASEVAVTLTDPAFVNVSGVELSALYTLLFSSPDGDIAGAAAGLYQHQTVQPSFAVGVTDRIVAAYFGKTTSNSAKTITLYHNGTEHYTNIETPIVTRHNDLPGLNADDYKHLTAAQLTVVQNTSGTNTGDQTSVLLNDTGVYTAPSIADNGDGTVTVGSGDYVFAQAADGTGPHLKFTITGGVKSFTDLTTNYILANYNSGSPTISIATSTATINNTTVLPIVTVFRDGTHLDILGWDEAAKAPTGKLQRRLVRTQRFAVEPNGLALGELTGRKVTVTSGFVWNALHQNSLVAFDSTNAGTDFLRLYVHVAGVYTKSTITEYNNTQYDNGTGVQTLTAGRYAVNWVFRTVNDNQKEVYILLGTGDYTLTQAQAAVPPSTLPAEITSVGVLLGRIIVQKSAATATQIDSAFVQNFNLAPTNDHAGLSNLAWSNAGHTGTVSSLAGFDAGGAAVDITDLTDGGDSTLHYHAADRVLGNITGMGTGVATALAVNAGIAGGVVVLDGGGLVPATQMPPSALERLVVVANQTARYALTTATVQNGDTVKQTDTGEMWYVIDQTNLGNSAGYAVYSAGTASAIAVSGITGLGTGVATALAVNVGTAGAPVVNGGVGGTPSSLTLTNATGLPAAGVSGTALVAAAIGSTVQAYDADLTTWASVSPGTGVATALAVNVGTAGAVVVNGGALGTPSSGVTDNLTTTTTTAAITDTDFVDTNLAAGGKRKILWPAVKTYLAGTFAALGGLATQLFKGLNFVAGYTTTVTSATPIVLTVASTYRQDLTGTTAQTVTLPDVTTLSLGHSFYFDNDSTATATVNSSGGNLVLSVPAGYFATVTCILITGTGAASWSASISAKINGDSANVFSVAAATAAAHAVRLDQLFDGWVIDPNTWTCTTAGVAGAINAAGGLTTAPVSAVFTVNGDLTDRFQLGTKLKWTQSTIKYGYVLSSSYSAGVTTVILVHNADYQMVLTTTTAITNQKLSQAYPADFPTAFNYVSAVTPDSGALTAITVGQMVFEMLGKTTKVHASITVTTAGTGAGALRFSYPNTPTDSEPSGSGLESLATGYALRVSGNAALIYMMKYDNTTMIANTRRFVATVTYS